VAVDPNERHRLGEELTDQLLAACAPIVDGLPTDLAVQVMAGAMLATAMTATKDTAGRKLILRRFALTVMGIANAMDAS
jgi:hypothetical protein